MVGGGGEKFFHDSGEHTNPFNSTIINAATEYIHFPIVRHTYKLHDIDSATWTHEEKINRMQYFSNQSWANIGWLIFYLKFIILTP